MADVQRLYRFLAAENPDAARRAVKSIRSGLKILAHQPHIGRPVDDMIPAYREWLIDYGSSGYVALYRIEGDVVALLAIRHQKEAGF